MKPSIYDLLSKKSMGSVTVTQLNTAVSNSDVDKASVEFWSGPITIQRAMDTRTYPEGLPIPELSSISSNTIANGATAQLKPTGTEIWRIQSIISTADISVSLYDGATNATIHTGTNPQVYSNLFIDPTLYIVMANGSGDEATCNISYHKVGL